MIPTNAPSSSTSRLSDRAVQRFPKFNVAQLAVVRHFAREDARSFGPGETISRINSASADVWFVLSGNAVMVGRNGLEQELPMQTLVEGQFSGELHQLGGGLSLVGVRAGAEGCTALPLDASRLRALIVGSADIGELMMRAFILRRVSLLEAGVGPVLVGRAGSSGLLRLQAFLTRSAFPHLVIDCASERGNQLLNDLDLPADDLPLVICPCGRLLKRPTNEELGVWLGITPSLQSETIYDVAVVGAGPAGLATAVYAASEGLSVLVVDRDVVGGQAGASARIENYLGFPTGISGSALAGRAINQAQKFGAQVAVPLAVTNLEPGPADEPIRLRLADTSAVRARTVVLACGARYRRPDVNNLSDFEGAGVHYWASPLEAKLCVDSDVLLIGAGNSAGQAAVYLSGHARHVQVMVRGARLHLTMSQYLVDRIEALSNVHVHVGTELLALHGSPTSGLEGATFRARATGELKRFRATQLFVFIGAEPNTAWLDGTVELDSHGYVVTGFPRDPGASALAGTSLQTSRRGVYAVGDVRSGSTKRVASAVGDGAAVVAQIHAALGQTSTSS
jgi:thioredoxin reductase (NADPH)